MLNKLLKKPEYFYQAILLTLTIVVAIAVFSSINIFKFESKVKRFDEGMKMEPQNLEELQFENIELGVNNSGPVKNISQNQNDSRERSYQDFSQDIDAGNASQESAEEFEKSLWEAAEGNEIRKELDKKNNFKNTILNSTDKSSKLETKSNQYAGKVMVSFKLGANRTAFQGNNWYVRNPGYTCGVGSGVIVVNISVGQDGFVRKASINVAQSDNSNVCMKEKALEYAYKSRFDIDASAPKVDEGYIIYQFVSQ